MITREKEEVIKYYNLGLAAYKQRKWDDAIKAFTLALQIDPNDGPSKEYLKRSKEFKIDPPADDWDGVYVMKTK